MSKKTSIQKRIPGSLHPAGSAARRIAELAAKISNDIAEEIDCGESRKNLRMAVAYWADVACVESQRRAEAESTVAIFKSAKALMDVVLPPNDGLER